MDSDIKRELEKIHREIKALREVQTRATWVSPSWITDLTGWNKEKLRMARQQGIVKYKESDGGGYLYQLESIPQQFILNKQAS